MEDKIGKLPVGMQLHIANYVPAFVLISYPQLAALFIDMPHFMSRKLKREYGDKSVAMTEVMLNILPPACWSSQLENDLLVTLIEDSVPQRPFSNRFLARSLHLSIKRAELQSVEAVAQRIYTIESAMQPRLLQHFNSQPQRSLWPLITKMLNRLVGNIGEVHSLFRLACMVDCEFFIQSYYLMDTSERIVQQRLYYTFTQGNLDAARRLITTDNVYVTNVMSNNFYSGMIAESKTQAQCDFMNEYGQLVRSQLNTAVIMRQVGGAGFFYGSRSHLLMPLDLKALPWTILLQCVGDSPIIDAYYEMQALNSSARLLHSKELIYCLARRRVVAQKKAASSRCDKCIIDDVQGMLSCSCKSLSVDAKLFMAVCMADGILVAKMLADNTFEYEVIKLAFGIAVAQNTTQCMLALYPIATSKPNYLPVWLHTCIKNSSKEMVLVFLRDGIKRSQDVWRAVLDATDTEFLQWFADLDGLPVLTPRHLENQWINKSVTWMDTVGRICERYNLQETYKVQRIRADIKQFVANTDPNAHVKEEWLVQNRQRPRIAREIASQIVGVFGPNVLRLIQYAGKLCVRRYVQLLKLLNLKVEWKTVELVLDKIFSKYPENELPAVDRELLFWLIQKARGK